MNQQQPTMETMKNSHDDEDVVYPHEYIALEHETNNNDEDNATATA